MITSENFGDLLEPGLRFVFADGYGALQQMRPLLFNVQMTDTSYVKDSSVGGFGDFQPFSGTLAYDDIYQGLDVTWTPVEYAKGFKVERRLWDDDLYNVIARKASSLGFAAARSQEKASADVFNSAFQGSGTIVVAGHTVLNNTDTVSLCGSTHSLGSSRVGSTQSNTGTTALSATAVETTRRNMAGFVDDTNNLIPSSPDTILVPRALEETAWQIISTKGEVASANNNANFHYGRYKLGVWDYLSDANNWFMVDSRLAADSLYWFDRIPLEFAKDRDFDNFSAKFSCYYRCAWGWRDYRFVFGHNVS